MYVDEEAHISQAHFERLQRHRIFAGDVVAEVERRLSVVEELDGVLTTNLQRATRLRQSILQKAFPGKLLTADSADKK